MIINLLLYVIRFFVFLLNLFLNIHTKIKYLNNLPVHEKYRHAMKIQKRFFIILKKKSNFLIAYINYKII